jgi:hypothetical protein
MKRSIQREAARGAAIPDVAALADTSPAPTIAANTLAAQIRTTPTGMATWAGTGPSGRTCEQCHHFNGTAFHWGWCAEFARLMKGGGHWRQNAQAAKIAPRFSALTAACRCFVARH